MMKALMHLAREFLSFLRQEHHLDVDELSPTQLVLRHRSKETAFDQHRRVVMRSGRVIASFDAIRSIELKRVVADEEAEFWEIRLVRFSGSSLHIGASSDDVEASIAASRISSMIQRPVQMG